MFDIKELFGIDNSLFNEFGKPIYMDSKYFTKKYFESFKKYSRKRNSKNDCMFYGCQSKSIKRSHIIPKSILKIIIGKDNILLNPSYDSLSKKIVFKEFGINNVTTFPLFCEKHENSFMFEKNNDFSDPSIVLQNYRVLSRDLFLLKITIENLENELRNYQNELIRYHKHLFKIAEDNRIIKKGIELKTCKDEIIDNFEIIIDKKKSLYTDLKFNWLASYVNNEKGKKIITIMEEYSFKIPLALAGRSMIKSNRSNYSVYLSILPKIESTALFFSIKEENENEFKDILKSFSKGLDILSFVESWMINATDYWYISSEIYKNWDQKKIDKICHDLEICNNILPCDLEYSIFDELRIKLMIWENNYSEKEIRKIAYKY